MRTIRTLYTAMMAKATDRELARMVSYLKEENRILRARLPEQINTTPRERERLLRFGRHLGTAIYGVVTIVSPSTFLRWRRKERMPKNRTFDGRWMEREPPRSVLGYYALVNT